MLACDPTVCPTGPFRLFIDWAGNFRDNSCPGQAMKVHLKTFQLLQKYQMWPVFSLAGTTAEAVLLGLGAALFRPVPPHGAGFTPTSRCRLPTGGPALVGAGGSAHLALPPTPRGPCPCWRWGVP